MAIEVLPTELSDWLVANGFAEAKPGYGHATGDEVADALIARYDIRPRPTPRGE